MLKFLLLSIYFVAGRTSYASPVDQLRQYFQKETPDRSIVVQGEEYDLFIVHYHEDLQEIYNSIIDEVLKTKSFREFLKPIMKSPFHLSKYLGVSKVYAENFVGAKMTREEAAVIQSRASRAHREIKSIDELVKILEKQFFSSVVAFAVPRSGITPKFFGYSDFNKSGPSHITSLMFDPNIDSKTDLIKVIVHEIAMRMDGKSNMKEEDLLFSETRISKLWGSKLMLSPVANLTFRVMRSMALEASVIDELSEEQTSIDLNPNLLQFVGLDKEKCLEIFTDWAKWIQENVLSEGNFEDNLKEYLRLLRKKQFPVDEKRKYSNKKATINNCLGLAKPQFGVNFESGGPKPRRDGW